MLLARTNSHRIEIKSFALCACVYNGNGEFFFVLGSFLIGFFFNILLIYRLLFSYTTSKEKK